MMCLFQLFLTFVSSAWLDTDSFWILFCALGSVWIWSTASPETTVRLVSMSPPWSKQRASRWPPRPLSPSSVSTTSSNRSQSRRRAGRPTETQSSRDPWRVKGAVVGPKCSPVCIYTKEALHGCCSGVGCALCLFTVHPVLLSLAFRRTVSSLFWTLNKAPMVVNGRWFVNSYRLAVVICRFWHKFQRCCFG